MTNQIFGDFAVIRRSALDDPELIEWLRGDGPADLTHIGIARSDGRVTYHRVDDLDPLDFIDGEGIDPSVHSIRYDPR